MIGFSYRYWDNVGGETLDAALAAAAEHARFIVSPTTIFVLSLFHAFQECGMISGYNTKPYPMLVSIRSNCPGP